MSILFIQIFTTQLYIYNTKYNLKKKKSTSLECTKNKLLYIFKQYTQQYSNTKNKTETYVSH